jgi:hypothetical protein
VDPRVARSRTVARVSTISRVSTVARTCTVDRVRTIARVSTVARMRTVARVRTVSRPRTVGKRHCPDVLSPHVPMFLRVGLFDAPIQARRHALIPPKSPAVGSRHGDGNGIARRPEESKEQQARAEKMISHGYSFAGGPSALVDASW